MDRDDPLRQPVAQLRGNRSKVDPRHVLDREADIVVGPLAPDHKWTRDQACAWVIWRDDAHVAQVGPGGNTKLGTLQDYRRGIHRFYDHPSSREARERRSETAMNKLRRERQELAAKPVVGSERDFHLAVQSGKLSPDEDGWFHKAKVLEVFPSVAREASAPADQRVTRPVQAMRNAYIRLVAERYITNKMSNLAKYREVRESKEVSDYINDAENERGLGDDTFMQKVLNCSWSGKPGLS